MKEVSFYNIALLSGHTLIKQTVIFTVYHYTSETTTFNIFNSFIMLVVAILYIFIRNSNYYILMQTNVFFCILLF